MSIIPVQKISLNRFRKSHCRVSQNYITVEEMLDGLVTSSEWYLPTMHYVSKKETWRSLYVTGDRF